MKEIKLYKLASCIIFLFVKSKCNNFIKEIKHVLRAKFVRILVQVKTLDCVSGFH